MKDLDRSNPDKYQHRDQNPSDNGMSGTVASGKTSEDVYSDKSDAQDEVETSSYNKKHGSEFPEYSDGAPSIDDVLEKVRRNSGTNVVNIIFGGKDGYFNIIGHAENASIDQSPGAATSENSSPELENYDLPIEKTAARSTMDFALGLAIVCLWGLKLDDIIQSGDTLAERFIRTLASAPPISSSNKVTDRFDIATHPSKVLKEIGATVDESSSDKHRVRLDADADMLLRKIWRNVRTTPSWRPDADAWLIELGTHINIECRLAAGRAAAVTSIADVPNEDARFQAWIDHGGRAVDAAASFLMRFAIDREQAVRNWIDRCAASNGDHWRSIAAELVTGPLIVGAPQLAKHLVSRLFLSGLNGLFVARLGLRSYFYQTAFSDNNIQIDRNPFEDIVDILSCVDNKDLSGYLILEILWNYDDKLDIVNTCDFALIVARSPHSIDVFARRIEELARRKPSSTMGIPTLKDLAGIIVSPCAPTEAKRGAKIFIDAIAAASPYPSFFEKRFRIWQQKAGMRGST